MKLLMAVSAALALSGCALIRYADGERVAIEHEHLEGTSGLQDRADRACLDSGGRAPARLVSNLPVNPALPPAMARHVATYRCQ